MDYYVSLEFNQCCAFGHTSTMNLYYLLAQLSQHVIYSMILIKFHDDEYATFFDWKCIECIPDIILDCG